MYELFGYKFNKEGQQTGAFYQIFYDLNELRLTLEEIKATFPNYKIFKNNEIIETNFITNINDIWRPM